MKRVVVIAVLGLLTFMTSQAQNNSRVEILTKKNPDEYAVVPVGREGIIAFTEFKQGTVNFTRFDTTLVQNWSVDMSYNPRLALIDHTFYDNYLYLLLGAKKRTEYQVIRLSVTAGFAEKFDFYTLKDLDIADFKAVGNDVYISSKTKSEPILLHVNLLTKKTQILPSAFKGKSQIQSIEIDKNTNNVNVAFSNNYKSDYKVIIKSYGQAGGEVKTSTVTSAPDKRLLTGRISTLNPSEELVIGTYGMKKSKQEYSQGMYISKLNTGQPNPLFTRYFSFTDFQNFFKFQSKKDQAKTERKISQSKKHGNDLKLEYRLLVHDVIQRDGQYIVVAEAYYPTYRSNYNNGFYPGMGFGGLSFGFGGGGYYNPYSMYNPYGYGYSPYGYGSRGNQIFDGYQYTHAVIAGFDTDGKLLWDNILEINDVKLMTLKEQVKISFTNENIILAYSNKGKIKSKVIRGNQVVEGKGDIPIDTEFTDDRIKKNQVSNIEYWYDNYFLAWGFQVIRNAQNQQAKGTRNVVYCNKIAF